MVSHHPEYDITVMLRQVPKDFETRYLNVKVVKGDYDSFDIVADTASQNEIVIRKSHSLWFDTYRSGSIMGA